MYFPGVTKKRKRIGQDCFGLKFFNQSIDLSDPSLPYASNLAISSQRTAVIEKWSLNEESKKSLVSFTLEQPSPTAAATQLNHTAVIFQAEPTSRFREFFKDPPLVPNDPIQTQDDQNLDEGDEHRPPKEVCSAATGQLFLSLAEDKAVYSLEGRKDGPVSR
jgi:hypothetical protein